MHGRIGGTEEHDRTAPGLELLAGGREVAEDVVRGLLARLEDGQGVVAAADGGKERFLRFARNDSILVISTERSEWRNLKKCVYL